MTGYLPEAQWYSMREEEFGAIYRPGNNRFSAKTTELIPVLARGLFYANTIVPFLLIFASFLISLYLFVFLKIDFTIQLIF